MGFFFDPQPKAWIRFCSSDELEAVVEWLKKHRLAWQAFPARGQGELKRHPRLSEQLLLKSGGSPIMCALCGARGIPCRQWIEGDDTDSIDYPNAARFYLCGNCVQSRMQPHPRLYAPADDQL